MLRDPALIPLSHQHQHGLALCVMVRRSLEKDAAAENVARMARRIRDRFEVELANHFAVEEEVVFPVCGEAAMVAELVAEHRLMERMTRESPAVERILEFCELLTRHIRREEGELFERMQRTMGREALEAAGVEIEQRVVRVCLGEI